jgi:hypothetical protein
MPNYAQKSGIVVALRIGSASPLTPDKHRKPLVGSAWRAAISAD